MEEGLLTKDELLSQSLADKYLFILREEDDGDYRGKIESVRAEGEDFLIFKCTEFSSRPNKQTNWIKISAEKSFRIPISVKTQFFKITNDIISFYVVNGKKTEFITVKPWA
jgi:hypothetical protein